MKKAATERLMDAIGAIHPQYVQEAEQWRGQAPQKKGGREGSGPGRGGRGGLIRLAAAACLVLVMGGAALALRNAEYGGMSGGAGGSTAGGVEPGAGADGSATAGGTAGNAGAGDSATAGGSESGAGDCIAEIPEGIPAVEAVYYYGGREDRILVEGGGLEALRAWVGGLELEEPVIFAEGEAPGEEAEGGEIYEFRFDGGEFSYRDFGACYLVVEDRWYPVRNPMDPPVW